jgi:hypothetical protein
MIKTFFLYFITIFVIMVFCFYSVMFLGNSDAPDAFLSSVSLVNAILNAVILATLLVYGKKKG